MPSAGSLTRWSVIGAALVLAFFLVWREAGEEPAPAGAAVIAPPMPQSSSARAATGTPTSTAPRNLPDVTVVTNGFEARFRAATDYLEFIESARSAAEGGDALAQLFIYRALEFCRNEYPFYFQSRKTQLSLDEGVRRTSIRWPYRPDYARKVYARCHDVVTSAGPEMKESLQWLRRSAEAEEPRAQALLASQIFRRGSDDSGPPVSVVSVSESRKLLGAALRSRHPEVIMQAGDLMYAIFGDDIWDHEIAAWNLVACERGADCGPDSDKVFFNCMGETSCQPYEGWIDIMRRSTSAEFPTIEQRAREIGALIDAGNWEELGFGETTSDP